MYHLINFIIKPFLFLLKNKKKEKKGWRDLSSERMILSYEELNKIKKYTFKEKILLFLLNVLFFLLRSTFKKKKYIQKKIPGNYYPLN